MLRAIWRSEPGALPRAQRIIRRVSVVSLTHDLLDNAATQAPAGLSTTAAIHLVSALTIRRDLTAFVATTSTCSTPPKAQASPSPAPPEPPPAPAMPRGPRPHPS